MPLQKPDRKEIVRLADSLLLRLDDAQLDLLEQEFASVVAQFERLLIIDTAGVAPSDFVGLPFVRDMRPDTVGAPSFTRDDMAQNTASLVAGGLLTVNKG